MAQQGEEIVVSGISCRLPESDSMAELRANLFSGEDMVTEDERRWPPGMHGLPRRCGKLKDISKFDASFFGVPPKQANAMDPQLRILLETSYEALVDAGINPVSLRGSRTGVFVGCVGSEAFSAWSDPELITGAEILGCSESMLANRLSYYYDFEGPSLCVDTACSSGLVALDLALQAIRVGECESALVCGSHLCLKPTTTLHFLRLGALSPEGICKTFDASGNGYTRSEGIVCVYIEKQAACRRTYATILHSEKSTNGFTKQGIALPSFPEQRQLLASVYTKTGIDPRQVSYIEAHGTATKAGDTVEANAIADVFCPATRTEPLLIGSVKSNLGHTEPSSGLVALAKVLIAMEEGAIPGNLHYYKPNPDVPALLDGRLRVVTKTTPWAGGYVGINCFGFGGTNVHLLLRSNDHVPAQCLPLVVNLNTDSAPPAVSTLNQTGNGRDVALNKDSPPAPSAVTTSNQTPSNEQGGRLPVSAGRDEMRLFVYAGRTREGLEDLLAALLDDPQDLYLHALLEQTSAAPLITHQYRGYALLNSQQETTEIQKCPSEKPALWYVFSGMGSQWPGMGRHLMAIPVFRRSIMTSHETLRHHGVHLSDIIMAGSEATLRRPLHSFVAIAAIQVALVDVLSDIGLTPDGIVGHSVGELGCAYADGGLTARETVLCAYWRGRCIEEANLPPGGMAAVGLSWEECRQRCPPGVTPACHNAASTVTISGPRQAVADFTTQLQSEDIFAREVDSAGVAFHSDAMKKVGPQLKKALEKVISEKRVRSCRWVSTSVSEGGGQEELARFSSADYHVNNLLSPVLFYQALQQVPAGAVLVELAPHALLQAVIKRALPNTTSIPLLSRRSDNNLQHLMTNLGRMYMAGLDLYPLRLITHGLKLFPVAKGTPMVSSYVEWDHSESRAVPTLRQLVTSSGGGGSGAGGGGGGGCCSSYMVDLSPDSGERYLMDHVVGGRSLYPAAGYLHLVWKTLAKMNARALESMPIAFENVHLHRPVILGEAESARLDVTLAAGSGHFFITESDQVVATGRAFIPNDPVLILPASSQPSSSHTDSELPLNTNDAYTELRLRGYDYGPSFQVIKSASNRADSGTLMWQDNWVSFIDGIIQMMALHYVDPTLRLPTRIAALRIDPTRHQLCLQHSDTSEKLLEVRVDDVCASCVSGGVEIQGLYLASTYTQRLHPQPVLEKLVFLPYHDRAVSASNTHLQQYTHLALACAQQALRILAAKISSDKLLNRHLFTQLVSTKPKCELDLEEICEYKHLLDCGLLQVAFEVTCLESDADVMEEYSLIMGTFQRDMIGDRLYANLLRKEILGPCLDTVLQNTLASKVKVVALCAGQGQMFRKVTSQLSGKPLLDVDYIAVDAYPDVFDEIELAELGVQVASWDLCSLPPPLLTSADLVVISNGISSQDDIMASLKQAISILKDSGFLLIHETTTNLSLPLLGEILSKDFGDLKDRTCGPFLDESAWRRVFEKCNLELISQKSDGLLTSLFLLRKRMSDRPKPAWISLDDPNFSWVEDVRALMEEKDDDQLDDGPIWLTSHKVATHSGIVGLVNCLRNEPGGHRIRCLLDFDVDHLDCDDVALVQLLQRDLVMNVRQEGKWGSFYHIPLVSEKYDGDSTSDNIDNISPASLEDYSLKKTPYAYVDVLSKGDLSSLCWLESPVQFPRQPDDSHSRCEVHCSAINFRDVMLATGKLSPDALPTDTINNQCLLGMEFSGVDAAGRRLMGIVPCQGLATMVNANRGFLWEVPSTWSLVEAASVPLVYATAYYALVIRGGITKGSSVLIHSGSGGVGQAAIRIALHYQCEIFTTVGSTAKRNFIRREFPQLDENHISNSRDVTFAWDILRQTGGRGVDLILDSLADDKLQASLKVLASHGRFLEIGKYDLSNDTPLGMSIFLKNISFHGILLDAIFEEGNPDWARVFALVSEGMKTGVVRPLTSTVFTQDQVVDAFRYMAQGKHIGKVIIQIREENQTPPGVGNATPARPVKSILAARSLTEVQLAAIPRAACDPTKSYIIAGGLGGFGLELAKWLVGRGATKLVLTSRSGVKTGYQARCVRVLRESGVQVKVSSRNIRSLEEAHALVLEATQLGAVGGVFNLAMILRDGLMVNQSAAKFQEVGDPKVAGTRNLDQVLRQHCGQSLHWFVVFSSVASGRGNAGQTNYGYANSAMERICEQRAKDGLPALAIQWGAIGDVGVLANMTKSAIGGTIPQRVHSCLQVLDQMLGQTHPVTSSYLPANKNNEAKDDNRKLDPVASVANILGVKDMGSRSGQTTLAELGLDSLMVVEVKQTLQRDYDMILSNKEIKELNIRRLRELAGGATSQTAASIIRRISKFRKVSFRKPSSE